jgi:hypothetical protein
VRTTRHDRLNGGVNDEAMSGDESVHAALSAELATLANSAAFTIIEFGADGGWAWTVSRDENGTPGARRSPLPAVGAQDVDGFYHAEVERLISARLALIACTAADHPVALAGMLSARHSAPVYECQSAISPLLREAIRLSPLTVPYELVVLKQTAPGQPDAGRLSLRSILLFPKGAESGFPASVDVRCAPTDERGTVFAVVTRVPVPGGPPSARRFGRIEIQSGAVPPGPRKLTARLVRPGHVQFELDGIAIQLKPESRPWLEIVRDLPDRLASPYPIHLICVIEVSGGSTRLGHRIEQLENLIGETDNGARPLRVSVLAYGPHSVERRVAEEPVVTLAWATTGEQAVRALRGLKEYQPHEQEYPRAAQLECALREIAANLDLRYGRPVLVTAGARPPHPPRVDRHTEIIPCRHRVSWREELDRLLTVPGGLRFGALCDSDAVGEIWRALGRDAIEEVEVVDALAFTTRLGLREPVQAVPFPLI